MARVSAFATCWLLAVGAASGADIPGRRLDLELGRVRLTANEWMTLGAAPWAVSRLTWSITAPTVTATAQVPLSGGWSLGARAQVILDNSGRMTDQDWLPPGFITFSNADWTHQSWHDETSLTSYLSADVNLRQSFAMGGGTTIGVSAAIGVRQMSWDARGGNWVYSDTSLSPDHSIFRSLSGTFTDGQQVISIDYLAARVLAGIDLATTSGPLTASGKLSAGFTLPQTFTDHHWLRDFVAEGTLDPAPVMAAEARVAYVLGPALQAYIAGRYERTFTAHGDRRDHEISTGNPLSTFEDVFALDIESAYLGIGLSAGTDALPMPKRVPEQAPSAQATWSADLGVIRLMSGEFVSPGKGDGATPEATIWQADAPLFTLRGTADLSDGWHIDVSGSAAVAAPASSRQVVIDGDLFSRTYNGYDLGVVDRLDTTDQMAKLVSYLDGSLSLSRDVAQWNTFALRLKGTVALDSASWRSTKQPDATLPAVGEITYALVTPRILAGVDMSATWSGWQFGLDTSAGMAFGAKATRRDSFRDNLIDIVLEPQPVLAAECSAEHALTPGLSAFARGGLEARFQVRGDERDFDLAGHSMGSSDGSSGGLSVKAVLAAGIRGRL